MPVVAIPANSAIVNKCPGHNIGHMTIDFAIFKIERTDLFFALGAADCFDLFHDVLESQKWHVFTQYNCAPGATAIMCYNIIS